jgi:beta-N-acetylhexosaminidase
MTTPAGPRGADRSPARAGRHRRLRTVLTVIAAVCAVVVAGVVGFALVRSAGSSQPASHHPAASSGTTGPAGSGSASPSPTKPATPAFPALSPAQLAGQRVIYSYGGLTPPAQLFRWIRAGQVAGVIFFGGNISSPSQLAGVVAELDRANASPRNPLHHYPLLLMTDQEGGLVRRLPGAPELSEREIGGALHPAAAAKGAGRGAGRNLARVGLNVNLAPVLDVYRAPGDFDDQFGRSYSTSTRQVSRLGASFIAAQQATGVAATAKHFPGLGAATKAQNTDAAPVTLNVTLHALRTKDEFPYQAAIAAGVKLVMVSWAPYSALAPKTPAGLSSAIVNGELRQRLGFKGVTITDALEAGALRSFGTTRRRATLAAKAGMDLILCSVQRPSQGQQARIALANGLTDGTLSPSVFNAALNRVIALRSSLGS